MTFWNFAEKKQICFVLAFILYFLYLYFIFFSLFIRLG